MSAPRAVGAARSSAFVVAGVASGVVLLAACGGKVDGTSSSGGGPLPPPTAQPPAGSSGAGRPGGSPYSPATAASDVATTYCKTFSSCCVGAGQPPIDAARCRVLTTAVVEAKLAAAGTSFNARQVAACVESIRARSAACANTDAAWWALGDVALFAPASVEAACAPLVGPPRIDPARGAAGAPCTGDAACGATATCAIDECTADGRVGQGCTSSSRCLDGAVCTGSTCMAAPGAPVGAACGTDGDCRLGLVCFGAKCASAREHPELYKERNSPYRVGADTCGIYTTL